MSAEQAPALAAGELADTSTSFWGLLRLSLRAHALFFIVALVYIGAEMIMSALYGRAPGTGIWMFMLGFVSTALPIFLLAVVTLRFCRLAIYERPARPLAALLRDLRQYFASPQRLANGLPVVVFLFLFMRTFGAFKAGIPDYNPFSWDVAFLELDRTLHFGADPWTLLQPILGFPFVTFIVNFLYNFWFMAMWIIWMWLGFSETHSHLRMQFFLAFVLCWMVGGTVLATIFSSAGPCYFGLVVDGPDPYAPLMAYLNRAQETFPILALNTQALLWDGYLGRQDVLVGISAMPSMHNATAVLFAFVGWRTSRRLGIVLSIYAGVILIGSVHLGWHYAVDSYAGALLAVALWWIAGRTITWYQRHDTVRAYALALDRC